MENYTEREKFKEDVEKLMRRALKVFPGDERLRVKLVNQLLEVRELLVDDERVDSRR